MRAAIIAAGLALGGTLSGCSMFTEYRAAATLAKEGVYTAIEDRQAVNDVKADVFTAIPCDMSLGAAMRIENDRKKAILIELCGGPPADSQVTVEDVARLLNAQP
jgi:hypothetical protein